MPIWKCLLYFYYIFLTLCNYRRTAFHASSLKNHTEMSKLLINRGCDVNVQNNYGNSALHFASMKGHVTIVELLVRHGADINLSNKTGYCKITKLFFSIKYGFRAVKVILHCNTKSVSPRFLMLINTVRLLPVVNDILLWKKKNKTKHGNTVYDLFIYLFLNKVLYFSKWPRWFSR